MATWGTVFNDYDVKPDIYGKGQGFFRYHNKEGLDHMLYAINGKLHTRDGLVPIEGLEEGFQNEREIEAVMMGDKLIIATGTKLVEYDGENAKVIEPYTPKPLEFLYVGTNALADDPDSHIEDGEAAQLRIDGVFADKRYGVIDEMTAFNIVTSSPASMTVHYKMEYRKSGEETWISLGNYNNEKVKYFKPSSTGEFELRFFARPSNNENFVPEESFMTYKVKETDENEVPDPGTIHTCNRILLHWDRLILYGDTGNRQVAYISHVRQYDYFPTTNSIEFTNKQNDPLVDVIKFRDMLVAFTPNSIQGLFGKSPSEFQRFTMNTDVGCVQAGTAKVMENVVVFLSFDGVYILKSVGTSEVRSNVQKIDEQVQNIIPYGERAIAVVHDYQYQILFTDSNVQFRYYYQLGSWTKDESPKLNFVRYEVFENHKYAQDLITGVVYSFEENLYNDNGFVYKDIVETKYYDFNEPYNPKKLKQIQVLMKHFGVDVNTNLTVQADEKLVLDTDQSHAVVVDGVVEWIVKNEPNLRMGTGTTFGGWMLGESPFGHVDSAVHTLRIAGKCRRTRAIFEHEEDKPHQVLGLGYMFKVKAPKGNF